MSDAEHPLWEIEESVEAQASPAFAFRWQTTVENIAADPGIERVETDGPYTDRPGMRGTNHLVGGQKVDWVISEAEPARRLVIDLILSEATVRFAFRFEEREGGGSVLTQRVSLFGPNAATYLEHVRQGFGPTLRDGMRSLRDRIDAARPTSS
jgi:hypothetical protein